MLAKDMLGVILLRRTCCVAGRSLQVTFALLPVAMFCVPVSLIGFNARCRSFQHRQADLLRNIGLPRRRVEQDTNIPTCSPKVVIKGTVLKNANKKFRCFPEQTLVDKSLPSGIYSINSAFASISSPWRIKFPKKEMIRSPR
jgi:hypothetical protein